MKLSVYDTMIKNNIIGFFEWLKRDKKILRIDTTDYSKIKHLIEEYLEFHFKK